MILSINDNHRSPASYRCFSPDSPERTPWVENKVEVGALFCEKLKHTESLVAQGFDHT